MMHRRNVLLGSVAAAVPLTAVSAAEAPSEGQPVGDAGDVPEFTIRIPQVQHTVAAVKLRADQGTSDGEPYVALKTDLAAAGYLPNTFDNSYEEGALPLLEKALVQETAKKTHNSRIVEPLLGEISSLLDRCLQYREQGNSIEIDGVAAAAAKAIFDATSGMDLEIVQSDNVKDVAAIIATNYPNAADQFRAAHDIGSATLAAAQAAANGVLRDSASGIHALSVEKLKFVQGITRQLMNRHEVEGNAHNFGERYERLRLLYNSDLEAAYRRALAVREGLEYCFGFSALAEAHNFKPEVPEPQGAGFVDALVVWTRNAMRAVTHVAQTEVEFEKLIVSAIGSDPAVLEISEDSFGGFRHVRLRSIAASFRAKADAASVGELDEVSFPLVMVKTTNNLGPLPIVVLPQVHRYSVSEFPVYNQSSSLYNVNPIGEWSLRLGKKGLGSSHYETNERADNITHIFFRMRVVASLDPEFSNGAWWTSKDRM